MNVATKRTMIALMILFCVGVVSGIIVANHGVAIANDEVVEPLELSVVESEEEECLYSYSDEDCEYSEFSDSVDGEESYNEEDVDSFDDYDAVDDGTDDVAVSGDDEYVYDDEYDETVSGDEYYYDDEYDEVAPDDEYNYDYGYVDANVDGNWIAGSSFMVNGVHYDSSGYSYTYYSENVLPGGGLVIPGRHVGDEGYVCDGNGNLCLASDDLPYGTVVNVPFGSGTAVVYDCGSGYGNLDVYVSW